MFIVLLHKHKLCTLIWFYKSNCKKLTITVTESIILLKRPLFSVMTLKITANTASAPNPIVNILCPAKLVGSDVKAI